MLVQEVQYQLLQGVRLATFAAISAAVAVTAVNATVTAGATTFTTVAPSAPFAPARTTFTTTAAIAAATPLASSDTTVLADVAHREGEARGCGLDLGGRKCRAEQAKMGQGCDIHRVWSPTTTPQDRVL